MTPPQRDSNLVPWKWAFIGAGSTVVLGLAGFGLWNLLHPKTSSTSTSLATATPENSVAKKLIGQWQTQISGQSLTLIFTPKGKLFIFETPTSATEMEYETDVTPEPKYLDILAKGQATKRTIFELTSDGQLHLELDSLGEDRPTSFSSSSRYLKKISEQTALPANVTVVALDNQQNRQREAKQYIASINKLQQAFYAEQGRFTSTLQELGLGAKSETEKENYSYSIVLSNDKRFVQSIALANKDGFKSYTGIVYLVKISSGEQSTSARLCESNQPSKELPGTPAATIYNKNELQCPLAYSNVVR